jgi:hypothetical protein
MRQFFGLPIFQLAKFLLDQICLTRNSIKNHYLVPSTKLKRNDLM